MVSQMNDRKEIIEMLYLLKEQAFPNGNKITQINDVSWSSFDFVITSAIGKLKEDGEMWDFPTAKDRKRKHEEFIKEFGAYLKKKKEETEWSDC